MCAYVCVGWVYIYEREEGDLRYWLVLLDNHCRFNKSSQTPYSYIGNHRINIPYGTVRVKENGVSVLVSILYQRVRFICVPLPVVRGTLPPLWLKQNVHSFHFNTIPCPSSGGWWARLLWPWFCGRTAGAVETQTSPPRERGWTERSVLVPLVFFEERPGNYVNFTTLSSVSHSYYINNH